MAVPGDQVKPLHTPMDTEGGITDSPKLPESFAGSLENRLYTEADLLSMYRQGMERAAEIVDELVVKSYIAAAIRSEAGNSK